MRLGLMVSAMLLCSGCVGPHATGSLWALQNAELEQALFRTSDGERAQQAQTFELGLADETLAAERSRLEEALRNCPTRERQPLVISGGDRVRDWVRIRAGNDVGRLATVAQQARADWHLRRANATGERSRCDEAHAALAGQIQPAQRSVAIDALGETTVARGRGETLAADTSAGFVGDSNAALSLYATGAVDAVRAAGPLPWYLGAVYGGTIREPASRTANPDAGSVVDQIVAAYPEHEPDALLAALR